MEDILPPGVQFENAIELELKANAPGKGTTLSRKGQPLPPDAALF